MAFDLSSLGRVNRTLALNGQAAQAMSFRIILQMLQSIAYRPHNSSHIKSLELTGIAPVSVTAVTSSQTFRKVMGKLKHLRLGFDDWYDILHTQKTISDTPIHATSHLFMESLVLSWLDKSCFTLEALIVEFREYAGVYPALNFGWIQFKVLTRIELLGVVIANADLVDKMMDLSDRIPFLYLVDYPIISKLETWMEVDSELYPIYGQNQPWTTTFGVPFYHYIVFEKLHNQWPNLEGSGFSSTSSATSYPRPYIFEGKLIPGCYKHYSCGEILAEAKAVRDAHYWDPGYQEYEPERTANGRFQEAEEVTAAGEAESDNTPTNTPSNI